MSQHILTKRPTDKIERPKLLQSYTHAMVEFLSVENPNMSKNEITRFVKAMGGGHLSRPQLDCILHSSPGNAEQHTVDLLDHINELSDKVISPFGVSYCDVNKKRSFLKDIIDDLKKGRSKAKKIMLQAKAAGDKNKANYFNANQSQQKITMNSMAGAMGSAYNFLSDTSGFNSITSIGRYIIMSSYANAERFLEGNFFFPTTEHVMDYLVLYKRICPSAGYIDDVLSNFPLYKPTYMDVYSTIADNYAKYNNKPLPIWVSSWLEKCESHELLFIYYVNNFKHLIQHNSALWQSWMDKFYTCDPSILDPTISPESIFKLDGDLVIVMSTVFNDWLPIEDGRKASIYDIITKHPELALRFASIGRHMTNMVNQMLPVFDLFMKTHTTINRVLEHKNMYRYTVIGSDTDSIIFTTKSWLQWYQSNLKIDQNAYRINTFVVFWLSKSTAYLLNTISLHRGALGDDIEGISMKNEYFYPVMTLSSLKKHYAALAMIQEGTILPSMMSDIKGNNLRGSKVSGFTTQYTKQFIDETHETIVKTGQVSATTCIAKVLQFEKIVYDSLMKGETKFLPIQPVNDQSGYTNSDSSLYFNYLFWKEVFSFKYNDMMLPTKCYIVPLRNLLDEAYLYYLERTDVEIRDRLVKFTEKYPDKAITRVPINPTLTAIPEELIPVANIKAIVADNAAPLYLYMRSLGITTGTTNKARVTFSDIYAPTLTPSINLGSSISSN